MAQGDRIFTSLLAPGVLHAQSDPEFVETVAGEFDTGTLQWLTDPDTTPDNTPSYPRVGDRSAAHPFMQVFNVSTVREESGMQMITASYRGALFTNAGNATKPAMVVPSAMTQVVTVAALTGGGSSEKRSMIVPVPTPTVRRTLLSTDAAARANPNYLVGSPVTGDFLPSPGDWGFSYLPDPDAGPLVINFYGNKWILMSRTWNPTVGGNGAVAWQVEEDYQWFYSLEIA